MESEQTSIAPAVEQGCRVQRSASVAYVAGFMFSASYGRVALIRKNKPTWQAGKLNGIGGKIEPHDLSAKHAMCREFQEETGTWVNGCEWQPFCQMGDGGEWSVDFFAAVGNVDELRSMEAEQVEIIDVASINPTRADMIENLPWLIALALDHLHDGRPGFVTVNYPR